MPNNDGWTQKAFNGYLMREKVFREEETALLYKKAQDIDFEISDFIYHYQRNKRKKNKDSSYTIEELTASQNQRDDEYLNQARHQLHEITLWKETPKDADEVRQAVKDYLTALETFQTEFKEKLGELDIEYLNKTKLKEKIKRESEERRKELKIERESEERRKKRKKEEWCNVQ